MVQPVGSRLLRFDPHGRLLFFIFGCRLVKAECQGGRMGFIAWIVTGLVAGWLAGQVMKGGGMIGSIIVAFVGAVILVWITRLLKKA